MDNMYNEFTGIYPVSKTLKFELIPQGRTQEYIDSRGYISEDEHRAESYKKVKKIIDRYHVDYIERALEGFKLEGLDKYYELYIKTNKSENELEQFADLTISFRKQIAKRLTANKDYNRMFKKELINSDLLEYVGNNLEERDAIIEFKGYSTYFQGFFENRKNLYSDEEKSTAIAYRLVNQNLPKFIDDIMIFSSIVKTSFTPQIIQIEENMNQILNNKKLEDVFIPDYFNNLLKQSGIEFFNSVIGGISCNSGEHIKGLNSYINEFNAKKKANDRIGKMKPLFKQILSDREKLSFIPESYSCDQEVLDTIASFHLQTMEAFEKLQSMIENISNYNTKGIFVMNDTSIQALSASVFGEWNYLKIKIERAYDNNYSGKREKNTDIYQKEKNKYLKSKLSFSIYELNQMTEDRRLISDYFEQNAAGYFEKVNSSYEGMAELLEKSYPENRRLSLDTESVKGLKSYLDNVKKLQSFIGILRGKGNEPDKDQSFYGDYDSLLESIDIIGIVYDKTRNYLTKKPYSNEKIKLNFSRPTFLDGWDVNKERANLTVLLRREGKYYLGIMDKASNKIFEDVACSETRGEFYEKMEYKQLPGPNKMLPKVFFSNSRIEEFDPSPEIMSIYSNKTYIKGPEFNIDDCHKLIDFYKASINKHEDWSKFGFQFSDTSSYKDISEFYREVESQGYMIRFIKIPVPTIDAYVNSGQLYLFQIYNKDFSSFSKGKKNLHTLYWNMLFDDCNLKDPIYKLNGQAEMFYRKKSITDDCTVIHKAGEPISLKYDVEGKSYVSVFKYDIIKDKRYTIDKYHLHVPVTMNFGKYGKDNINSMVRIAIRNSEDIHIIGIDRGERNLLYISVIDEYGSVVEQFSLNNIVSEYNGVQHNVNYHYLLSKREKERMTERREWQTIENINELKEGYLSQAVHKITQLMVKYNAIVVLEDLNFGFKRGRQKVEKQVYQKFEKMLIDKLNYYVDKSIEPELPGGILKAYQLTSRFESFNKLGKQCGFLFYTQPWNTSNIDPCTGFTNLFYSNDLKYESIDSTRNFWSKFDDIKYNAKEDYFEFSFDYSNFNGRADGTQTSWTVCTNGSRIVNFRDSEKKGQWNNLEINVNEEVKNLLKSQGIDIKAESLLMAICEVEDKEFQKRLLSLFKMTLQMRNSIIGTDEDYILSPVMGNNNAFFDSRKSSIDLPENADANGAYNIARKGLIMVHRIKSKGDDIEKISLAISNKDWLSFVQEMGKQNG